MEVNTENCLETLSFFFQAMKASVVKREPNGPLHVELFESSLSCPSLNVQLVKMGFAEIDPLQCNLSRSDFSCLCPVDGKSLNPQRLNNNQFSSGRVWE